MEFDHGDVPTAWFNLGLHEVAAPPSQAQFEDYCVRLIRRCREMRTRSHTRKRRFQLMVMAIKTISGQSRAHMSTRDPPIDFPHPGDMPRGRTWAVRMAELAAGGGSLPPLAAPVIDAMTSKAANRVRERHLRKISYRQAQDRGGLSARDMMRVSQNIRAAEWELANRYSVFTALNNLGLQNLTPVTTVSSRLFSVPSLALLGPFGRFPPSLPLLIPSWVHHDKASGTWTTFQVENADRNKFKNKQADNSLWHALSYQINGPGVGAADSSRLGLRGGRREKAWLYHYFTEVLHDPNHIRHRLYTRLAVESQSILRPGHDPQTTAQMPDWGELSMLRCLAVNNPHGGVPKWPQFEGIFQLIADFWRQEVVVFVGPRGAGGWRAPYRMRAFGKQEHGASDRHPSALTGLGQLLFVTDEDMQHFDAVEYHGPAGGRVFDTSHLDEDGRYSQLRMPFLDLPGFVPPVSRAPADIPPTTNGVAPGAPGHVAYGRPSDDPRFRLPDDHPLVVCYEHDRDAIETRPGFGEGRMPRLSNMITMGSWTTEQGAPGVDARPTAFEPWLVTSGCYRTLVNPTMTRQGRYANNKAYLIAKYAPEFEGEQITRPRTIV